MSPWITGNRDIHIKIKENICKHHSDSIFDRQSETLRTEAVQVNSSSHEEDFDDVGRNADLYASRQDAFQGSSRGSDERSQQQNDLYCFQSLSLD